MQRLAGGKGRKNTGLRCACKKYQAAAEESQPLKFGSNSNA
jgi:hypothetical protein